MLVKDLGCWKDNQVRAIRILEGQFPTLKDKYKIREDAKKKCIQTALSLGNTLYRTLFGRTLLGRLTTG